MRSYLLLIILFYNLILIIQCNRDPHSIDYFHEVPSIAELRKIDIVQSFYDSLIIKNEPSIKLKSKSVLQVSLFDQDKLVAISSPEYFETGGYYTPIFEFKILVDDEILFYNFHLSYLLFDSTTIELDSVAVMCKYPYESADIYFQYKDLPYPIDPNYKNAEDIDFTEGKFYYRAAGSHGIYEIDEQSGRSKILVEQVSHNFISVDSGSVFLTTSPQSVFKYDLETGNYKELLSFNNSSISDSVIIGMESDNGVLYLIIENEKVLLKYDYNGKLLESSPYFGKSLGITRYEDNLYSIYYGEPLPAIIGLDIQENRFKGYMKLLPSQNTIAIRIADKFLYYSEWKQAYIGRIPLEDIDILAN